MRGAVPTHGAERMKTLLKWLCLLCLTGMLISPCLAEDSLPTRTGYYTERKYLRCAMDFSADCVDSVPAYTVLTILPRDDQWAECTSPRGRVGFLYWPGLLPVPDYDPEPAQPVCTRSQLQLLSLPFFQSASLRTVEADTFLLRDGTSRGYAHVRMTDGTEGYVLSSHLAPAPSETVAIDPVALCVAEPEDVGSFPLLDAPVLGTLEPGRLYTADREWVDWLALTLPDGQTGFVCKKLVCLCDPLHDTFFRPPDGRSGIRHFYSDAVVCTSTASLLIPGQAESPLTEGAHVFVCSDYAGLSGVYSGSQKGYVPSSALRLVTQEERLSALDRIDLSAASIQASDLLDSAFSMLEEGNPIAARYGIITGNKPDSLFPLGVPYFWGGRSYTSMTERLPDYTTRECWQSSPTYYRQGKIYLLGLDCIGFVKTVFQQASRPIDGMVVDLGADPICQAGHHVFCSDQHPLPADWREAAVLLRPGDLLVVHHPGTHAMVFVGTLRNYGYTKSDVPALADLLDIPLMIHCGENPLCHYRLSDWIQSASDPRIAKALPPDGGVSFCLLGVPPGQAERTLVSTGRSYPCFNVEGACVTCFDFSEVTDYFVYRD